jgi:hypothetical protein
MAFHKDYSFPRVIRWWSLLLAILCALASTFPGHAFGATHSGGTTTPTNICVPVQITSEPSSVSLVTSNGVTLTVGVSGTPPITFQWYHNGVPISGAIGPSLTLTNLEAAQDGFYSVAVSNCGGSVESRRLGIFVNTIIVDLPLPGTVLNFTGSFLPPDLTNIVAIASGAVHALALRENTTVAAWGNDWAAAFGVTNVPRGLSNVVAISAGYDYSLALRGTGEIVGWGVGDCSRVPVTDSRFVALSAGPFRASALTAGGTVLQWGLDLTLPGELADVVAVAEAADYTAIAKKDGTIELYGAAPVGSVSQPGNVLHLAADQSCYGLTGEGLLHDLTSSGPPMPAGLGEIASISVRHGRCMALTKAGSVVAWGNVNVPMNLRNVSAIAAGGLYCLALTHTPPTPQLAVALTADHQLELSAPLAVSGWQLTTTPNLDQPFTPADLTSSIISCGTPERPALTIRPENSARFFRFRKF